LTIISLITFIVMRNIGILQLSPIMFFVNFKLIYINLAGNAHLPESNFIIQCPSSRIFSMPIFLNHSMQSPFSLKRFSKDGHYKTEF
jgi:hypothetical protein